MDDRIVIARTRLIAVTAFLIIAASGCAQFSWLNGSGDAGKAESVTGSSLVAADYIEELARVAGNDPAEHAEIFADASATAKLTSSPFADLRLGLILATPGHSESDPERAQRLLREVLSQELLLTPTELYLATIYLNSADRQLVADAEARQLRASSSLTQQTQDHAIAGRLAIVEAENRQLRLNLEEAERKLEAITSIERSIREKE